MTNIGGMQRVADELLRALEHQENASVRPLVLRTPWRWIYVRVLPFLLGVHHRLRRLADADALDAVLFTSLVSSLPVIFLSSLFRSKQIHTAVIVHGLDITAPLPLYQELVSLVFERADQILPVSSATARACLERGCPEHKIRVLHNGVDPQRFKPVIDQYTMRRELRSYFDVASQALPDGAILLSSVGRLVKRKGFSWFIREVLPLLPNNVHYWIAGSGPEKSTIEATIAASCQSHRVRLLGLISDDELQALYRGSDVFIMPNIPVENDMEGFGIVMLEAGMNGLPTIGARLEGIEDVIENGENGILVEPGNPEAFRKAVSTYCDNPSLLLKASRQTRAYTKNTFAWEVLAQKYLSAIGDLPTTE